MGSGQVVPIKAEGLHVEWDVSVKSVLAEGKKGLKLGFTKFENSLTREGVVLDVVGLGGCPRALCYGDLRVLPTSPLDLFALFQSPGHSNQPTKHLSPQKKKQTQNKARAQRKQPNLKEPTTRTLKILANVYTAEK